MATKIVMGLGSRVCEKFTSTPVLRKIARIAYRPHRGPGADCSRGANESNSQFEVDEALVVRAMSGDGRTEQAWQV